jgi:hypothetical protein
MVYSWWYARGPGFDVKVEGTRSCEASRKLYDESRIVDGYSFVDVWCPNTIQRRLRSLVVPKSSGVLVIDSGSGLMSRRILVSAPKLANRSERYERTAGIDALRAERVSADCFLCVAWDGESSGRTPETRAPLDAC